MMLSLDCQEIEFDPEKVELRIKQEKQKIKLIELEKKKANTLSKLTRKDSSD